MQYPSHPTTLPDFARRYGDDGLDPRFGHPAETTVDALCSRGEDASPRMR